MLFTKEFQDLMKTFEKSELANGYRKDKEDRDLWKRKLYYQHGELNRIFIAYMHGYSLGKAIFQN